MFGNDWKLTGDIFRLGPGVDGRCQKDSHEAYRFAIRQTSSPIFPDKSFKAVMSTSQANTLYAELDCCLTMIRKAVLELVLFWLRSQDEILAHRGEKDCCVTDLGCICGTHFVVFLITS